MLEIEIACDEMTQQYQKKYSIEQVMGHGRRSNGDSIRVSRKMY